jgi:hypothetical protein
LNNFLNPLIFEQKYIYQASTDRINQYHPTTANKITKPNLSRMSVDPATDQMEEINFRRHKSSKREPRVDRQQLGQR